ncbi:hypothetical protein T07_5323 [Trichinella nelsoni]|uniref:Uncharacterized protein n=1 Tax=Trichinella nelsoni TaxID=6336 RepID=A0A0V0SL95_9BILA|nr:hypothetical protein T07_5323 [Trichinella nelsoni]
MQNLKQLVILPLFLFDVRENFLLVGSTNDWKFKPSRCGEINASHICYSPYSLKSSNNRNI